MGKRGQRYNEITESLWDNSQSWVYYAKRLTELAISLFEWKNLPETVDERYLELALFKNGSAVFFQDEVLGYLALQVMGNGYLDIYGIPKRRRAYAPGNGYQKNLTRTNSVIIYNDRMHTNGMGTVKYYAKRLWDLDRTIDVNCRAQKTPVLLHTDENNRLTLENAYMQFDGNKPLIVADKSLNLEDAVKVLKTDAPFVVPGLYTYKTQLWNEALTALGISNVSFQKKERMLHDEVNRSMGGVFASRYSRLTMRQEAAKKINDMFGLDIQVDFRQDDNNIEDEDPAEQMEEGDGDE